MSFPNTKGHNLIADVSSCFLSESMDVTKVRHVLWWCSEERRTCRRSYRIIREDLITEDTLPGTPTMLKVEDTGRCRFNLYNTPPCYNIYMCGKVFKWIKRNGGLAGMKEKKTKKLRFFMISLMRAKLFMGTVEKSKEDRSLMNVPFVTGIRNLMLSLLKKQKQLDL